MTNILLISAFLVFSISASAQVLFTSLEGNKVAVERQTRKAVVLAIGASWLPLSDKQANITNALVQKYRGSDVVFYFVATDSMNAKSKNFADDATLTKFATDMKLKISVLRDPDAALMIRKYKVEQVPSFVILDKNGKIAGEPFGGIDPKFDVTIPISLTIDKLL